MKKRIALLIRNRQSEALRMGLGLTILNDEIDLYFLKRLERAMQNSPDLSLIKELGMETFTILEEERDIFDFVDIKDIARRLLEYDIVIAY